MIYLLSSQICSIDHSQRAAYRTASNMQSSLHYLEMMVLIVMIHQFFLPVFKCIVNFKDTWKARIKTLECSSYMLNILCCGCCFYFISLLIHVFSSLSPPAPFLFSSIYDITLSLNLSHPQLYLVQYYRFIFTRSISAHIIAHLSVFHHLIMCTSAYCELFQFTRKGSLTNGRPPLHPGMSLTTLNFVLLLLTLANRC